MHQTTEDMASPPPRHHVHISSTLALAYGGSASSTNYLAQEADDLVAGGGSDGSSLAGLLSGREPPPKTPPQHELTDRGSPTLTTFDSNKVDDKPPAAKRPRATQVPTQELTIRDSHGSGWSWDGEEDGHEIAAQDAHSHDLQQQGLELEDHMLPGDTHDQQQQQQQQDEQAADEPPPLTGTIMNGVLM